MKKNEKMLKSEKDDVALQIRILGASLILIFFGSGFFGLFKTKNLAPGARRLLSFWRPF